MTGSFESWRTRIPALPAVVSQTRLMPPLVPMHIASSCWREGIQRLEQLEGLTVDQLLDFDYMGRHRIDALFDTLRRLCALPHDRLARLGTETSAVPHLSVAVLDALCRARSVDDEITALVCDLPERNRALVLAHWGYCDDGPQTIRQVGDAFGITSFRARELIVRTEWSLKHSGLRLPLASAAIADLDEIGGATMDADYRMLLGGEAGMTLHALQVLPTLHRLGCVPEIVYDSGREMWVTSAFR